MKKRTRELIAKLGISIGFITAIILLGIIIRYIILEIG